MARLPDDWMVGLFIIGFFTMVCFGLWIGKTEIDMSKIVKAGHLTHNGQLYIVRPAKVVEE